MGQHWQRNVPEPRFWKKVLKGEACWDWQGPLKKGYGAFYYNGHQGTAHRFSWELHHGAVPAGLLVCHKCDNPRCVRPDHLFLGTFKDNNSDSVRKGRSVSAKAQCRRGHDLVPSNLYYFTRKGYACKQCRACARLRDRNRRKVA